MSTLNSNSTRKRAAVHLNESCSASGLKAWLTEVLPSQYVCQLTLDDVSAKQLCECQDEEVRKLEQLVVLGACSLSQSVHGCSK